MEVPAALQFAYGACVGQKSQNKNATCNDTPPTPVPVQRTTMLIQCKSTSTQQAVASASGQASGLSQGLLGDSAVSDASDSAKVWIQMPLPDGAPTGDAFLSAFADVVARYGCAVGKKAGELAARCPEGTISVKPADSAVKVGCSRGISTKEKCQRLIESIDLASRVPERRAIAPLMSQEALRAFLNQYLDGKKVEEEVNEIWNDSDDSTRTYTRDNTLVLVDTDDNKRTGLAIPMSRAQFPILPLDIFDKTITPEGAGVTAGNVRAWQMRLAVSIALTGSASGYIVFNNGNACQFKFWVDKESPGKLLYEDTFAKAGEYSSSNDDIVFRGAESWSVIAYGSKKRKAKYFL